MTNESPLCRLCRGCPESVWHMVSGCTKLAQREYKFRHDKVAFLKEFAFLKESIGNWVRDMASKAESESGEKWYEHQPLPVIKNDQEELMWDNTIITDTTLLCATTYTQKSEIVWPSLFTSLSVSYSLTH